MLCKNYFWNGTAFSIHLGSLINNCWFNHHLVFFAVLQITASVDFTLISNHLDPQAPIRVEFKLEGQRFKHEPGQFRFREKWLMDIIEHKKKLIRQVSL